MAISLSPKKAKASKPAKSEKQVTKNKPLVKPVQEARELLKGCHLVSMQEDSSMYVGILADLTAQGELVEPEIGRLSQSPVSLFLRKEDFTQYTLPKKKTEPSRVVPTIFEEEEEDRPYRPTFEVSRNG